MQKHCDTTDLGIGQQWWGRGAIAQAFTEASNTRISGSWELLSENHKTLGISES